MKISSCSRSAHKEPCYYNQTRAQQGGNISRDTSHHHEGVEWRTVSPLQVIAAIGLVLIRAYLERINILMFINGHHDFMVGSEPRVTEFVSLENTVVPLISWDQGEGTVLMLARDPMWCGEGLLLATLGHLVMVFHNHSHRGQIKLGAPSSEAHRRFCGNPLILSQEGQVETTAKGSVGWEKSDKHLSSVYISSGLGTPSFSEAQTKKPRNRSSFRGWLWKCGFLCSHFKRFTLFNVQTQ